MVLYSADIVISRVYTVDTVNTGIIGIISTSNGFLVNNGNSGE